MYAVRTKHVLLAVLAATIVVASVWAGPAEDQYSVAAGHYVRQQWALAAQEYGVYLEEFAEADPARTVSATFFSGEALVQLGRFEEANARFRQLLKNDAKHPYKRQVLFRCGETAYLTGKRDEARGHLDAFRKEYRNDKLCAYALPYLAEMTLADGDAPAAQKIYVEALKRFPKGALADECRYGLGRALRAQGDAVAAANFFTYLAGTKTSLLADDAQLQLGLTQYDQKRYAQAAKTLGAFQTTWRDSKLRTEALYWLGMTQIARRQWDSAVKTLNEAGGDSKHARMPEIVFFTAEALRELQQYDEAARHYDRVLSNWPDSDRADDSLLGKLHAAAGQDDARTVDAIVGTFDRRHADSPLRERVRRAWGRSLLRRKKYDEAVAVFEELAKASDEGSNAYLLALAQLGKKQYDDALAALDGIKPNAADKSLAHGVRIVRASALMGLERYTEAIEPLTTCLESNPNGGDDAECRAHLTVALAATGKLDEAGKAFDVYLVKHAKHPRLLPTAEYLAEAAFAAGDRQRARRFFAIMARQGNPPNVVARGLSGLTWSEAKAEDPADSSEAFQRLRDQHPNSPLVPEAALARAKAFEKLNKPDAALAMYRSIIDEYPNSEQIPKALMGAAELHDRLQQDKQAEALLARLAKEFPKLEEIDAVLYRWAWVLIDLKKPDEADAVFTRIHMEQRESRYWADATYRLAARAEAAGKDKRAEQLVDEILDSTTGGDVLGHALDLKGRLAARSGRWPEVIAPMERLLNECPDSPLREAAAFWIAESLYRQKKYDEARKRLDELARQTKDRNDAWLAVIPLRQAQILAQNRKWREARETAESIAGRFPDFSQQHEADYLAGRCLATEARFSEARERYERVIHSATGGKTETAAMAQWMIGETFFHQKEYDEAIRAYSRVEILYDYPRWRAASLLQIGKCYEMKGEWRQAVERYAQLLKQYSETAFAEDASRRLSVARERATTTVTP